MHDRLEELLQEVRDEFLRNGDHEGAGVAIELIAASVALDELNAAARRQDDDAASFHAKLLERLLAGIGTHDFRIAGGKGES